MTEGFQTVLAASEQERRDLFVGVADRLRTNEQNIEKDFWVCWTLDALFNGLETGGPRLLFKGGTSLSKGYGLIERFSEDIDITVFREDIGEPATVEELEALSGKKRNTRLEGIKAACQEYIQGPMLEQLSALLRQTLQTANVNADRVRVEADPNDPDGQSLLLWYPTATTEGKPSRRTLYRASPSFPERGEKTPRYKSRLGVIAYRAQERAFSVGDRIQFTSPDNEQKIANRELGTVEEFGVDGRMRLKLDGERSVSIDPEQHPHIDHGYAMTSYSSQGQTAERVLVHVDTELGAKDLLNNRMAYVAISRGQNDAQIFTNSADKLAGVLARDVSHQSALGPQIGIAQPVQDIAKALHSELSHGIELGLSL